jgi:hypothetical protein
LWSVGEEIAIWKGTGMGRPPRDTEAVMVRLHRKSLDAIDDLRKQRDAAPSRPELIRQILREHLKGLDYDVSEWDD